MKNLTALKKVGSLQSILPILALTMAAFFWSGNFIAGRYLNSQIDPIALNTIRWLICILIFLPFVVRRILASRQVILREWKFIVCLGITGIATFHTLVYFSLTKTTAINALLLLSLTPVLILLGAMLFTHTKVALIQWMGAITSLIGVGIIISQGSLDTLLELNFSSGDLWMLGAVIIWSTYSLILKQRPADLPQDVTLAMSIIAAIIVLLPFFLAYSEFSFARITTDTLIAILYIAIFASLLAFLLWSFGVSEIGPEISGQFIHLMPIFGAILAILILGEKLIASQIIGALFVFLGLILASRSKAS